jgi:hypothetical protein
MLLLEIHLLREDQQFGSSLRVAERTVVGRERNPEMLGQNSKAQR